MKYIVEIPADRAAFAEEFFKTVSFIRTVKFIADNEVTNPAVLHSMEQYERGLVKPTPLNLEDLKQMIHA
ncbi:MAG: hypothetical protein LBE91_18150 [Tannerella sp.]|jgi:hypothetical protein|nr:hypothetical protein [Tannerella sp.]